MPLHLHPTCTCKNVSKLTNADIHWLHIPHYPYAFNSTKQKDPSNPTHFHLSQAAMVKVLENSVVDLDLMPGQKGEDMKKSVDGAT